MTKQNDDDLGAIADDVANKQEKPVSELKLDEFIERFSQKTEIEYEPHREEASKRYKVRTSVLDKAINQARATHIVDDDIELVVEELLPYEGEVDGLSIADSIEKKLRAHVKIGTHDYTVVTLWVILTYCFDDFGIVPKLLIKSPEHRCGKSTLLEVLDGTTHRALPASNITAASLFRTVDLFSPTLLLDEADTYMKDNEDMRGIVNSGHRKRTAFIVRLVKVGDDYIPKKFSTWGAMAISGIGSQATTVMDRSIIINMQRKLASESVARMDHLFVNECKPLRQKVLRWTIDNKQSFKQARPTIPPCSNDRTVDNWYPLFAIAEVLDSEWVKRIIEAFIHATVEDSDDEYIGTMLLEDIKEILNKRNSDGIHSRDLVEDLVTLEGRPWSEWRRGNPMTANLLAKLLKTYGIKSKQIKLLGINRHGYLNEQFSEAFEHYIPTLSPDKGLQNATTLKTSNSNGFSDIQNATDSEGVAFSKQHKASNSNGCSTVAFQTLPTDEDEDIPW